MAFVVGAVTLTILPFAQRRFLSAPPPIADVHPWTLLPLLGTAPITQANLAGKVVLLSFAESPCADACLAAQRSFGSALFHTEDLGDSIHLVTIADASAEAVLRPLQDGRWHFAAEGGALLPQLEDGWRVWAKQPEAHPDFRALRPFVLLDARGRLRGFWKSDGEGRGNAINSARMLAKYPDK